MGKITEIRRGKSKKDRVTVFIDGKPELSLYAGIVLEEKLAENDEIDDNKVRELENRERARLCYEAAQHLLSYRPRSEQELKERLIKRRFGVDEIGITLDKLKKQGLLDDNYFAEFWVENREAFKPESRYLVTGELRRKGVAEDVIAGAVNNLDDEENAYRAGSARARRMHVGDFEDFQEQMGNFLRRRGFSYEVIKHTIERIWQETER